jgi:hypothetical protein
MVRFWIIAAIRSGIGCNVVPKQSIRAPRLGTACPLRRSVHAPSVSLGTRWLAIRSLGRSGYGCGDGESPIELGLRRSMPTRR